MDALILVDLQNDFLPGGSLAVPDGDKVVPIANRLMAVSPMVVATKDWHPSDHGSFAVNNPGHQPGEIVDVGGHSQVLWPIHCVQGTFGAEFAPDLEVALIQAVFEKGLDPKIDSYSGFFDNQHRRATGLDAYLQEHSVTRVWIMGLATDYCVKFTVMDAIKLGFETMLVQDGCRGVELEPGDVRESLRAMDAAGAMLTDCNTAIQMLRNSD